MPYITYLTNSRQTNAASYHAGYGKTKEESKQNSCYWANQLPWVRTVAFSKAPKWAVDQARDAYHAPCVACGKIHPGEHKRTKCLDRNGFRLPITEEWENIVKIYEF